MVPVTMALLRLQVVRLPLQRPTPLSLFQAVRLVSASLVELAAMVMASTNVSTSMARAAPTSCSSPVALAEVAPILPGKLAGRAEMADTAVVAAAVVEHLLHPETVGTVVTVSSSSVRGD